jgi:hypothetical protein
MAATVGQTNIVSTDPKITENKIKETPWKLSPEEKESVSTSITQTWTDQAIKCYLTNADCANCSIPRGNYSFQCQMDKVVPVLLDNLGQPDPNRINKLLPYMSQY